MSENDHIEKHVTARQRGAIVALMSESSTRAAAQKADVPEQTLRRWLANDATFQAALSAAESIAIAAFSRALVILAEKATEALEDALKPEQKMSYRLRAADLVSGRLLAVRELAALEQRIVALERRYEQEQARAATDDA